MDKTEIENLIKEHNKGNKDVSWIKTNIMEVLAILAVTQFLLVICFVLFKDVKSNDTTTMMILTSSTNVLFIVLTFYFGSSKGSRDKQVKIDETENKS